MLPIALEALEEIGFDPAFLQVPSPPPPPPPPLSLSQVDICKYNFTASLVLVTRLRNRIGLTRKRGRCWQKHK